MISYKKQVAEAPNCDGREVKRHVDCKKKGLFKMRSVGDAKGRYRNYCAKHAWLFIRNVLEDLRDHGELPA